jgi:exonuclease III
MKIVSWNIRGLNGKRKHRIIINLLAQKKSTIIMLQETKCSSDHILTLASILWKDSIVVAINSQGSTEGLAIIWNPQIVSISHFISTLCSLTSQYQFIGSSKHGYITNVYGPNPIPDKLMFLYSLQSVNHLIGDTH